MRIMLAFTSKGGRAQDRVVHARGGRRDLMRGRRDKGGD